MSAQNGMATSHHGSIKGDRGPDIVQRFMSFVALESNAEELAQRSKLIIGGRAQGLVLVKEPQRPLVGAEHPRMCGQEAVESFEPSREKGGVEGRVVRDELRDTVSAAIGRDQVDRGMPLEELGKSPSRLSFGDGFASPDVGRVMRPAQTSGMDLVPLKAEFHFERFEFSQSRIDGDCGKLHDWPPRLPTAGFQVDENKSFVGELHAPP